MEHHSQRPLPNGLDSAFNEVLVLAVRDREFLLHSVVGRESVNSCRAVFAISTNGTRRSLEQGDVDADMSIQYLGQRGLLAHEVDVQKAARDVLHKTKLAVPGCRHDGYRNSVAGKEIAYHSRAGSACGRRKCCAATL